MSANGHAPGQPLVSVVLPTADRPRYLKRALQSAIDQTYRNIEILVRDNASGPETGEVIRQFRDERIQYLRHDHNVGMTQNVIGGFQQAKGKYVTNLHDDDFWEADFLQKTVTALEAHPEAVIAFSDHYIVDLNDKINTSATEQNSALFNRTKLAPGIHKPFKKLALVDLSIPVSMATVFRRQSIDWNDFPNLASSYDFWLAYLACRNNDACYYVAERLTSYRVHPASETSLGRVRLNKGLIEIYERMMLDPRVAELRSVFRERLGIHHTDAAIALLRRGENGAARRMLLPGAKYRFDLKTSLAFAASYLSPGLTRHFPGKLSFPASRMIMTPEQIATARRRRFFSP